MDISLEETMRKHGFIYSDVDQGRATDKAAQYRVRGYNVEVVRRDTGWFVILEDRPLKD